MKFLKYFRLPSLVLIILAGLFATSCIKDKFEFDRLSTGIEWNPNIAVPAVVGRVTVRDFLEDYDTTELFVEDQTGFLYLLYNERVFSVKAEDLVTIPNQDYTSAFSAAGFSAQGFPTIPSVTITDSTIQNFAVSGGEQVKSIIFKTADLNISLSSTFLHTGNLTVLFPTIKHGTTVYSKNIPITSASGTFSISMQYSDLAGYTMDLENPDYNKLPVVFKLTLNSSGAGLVGNEQASIDVSLTNIKYSILYGFIGQKTIDINPDTVQIDLFNHALDGELYFQDPRMRIKVRNSYGVPMRFTFSDFGAYSTEGDQYMVYPFPNAYNPLTVGYPLVGQEGQISNTNILLDTLNYPPIRNFVEFSPKYLFFDLSADLNYNGSSPDNFVLDTSRFDVDLEVELPLWGRASWFAMQDTNDFDFGKYYDNDTNHIKDIEWVLVRINVDNFMPTEVGIQVLFADSLYHVKDSVFLPTNQEVVSSGVINSDGRVIAATRKTTDVLYDKTRIGKLIGVKYVFFRGMINTTDQSTRLVKFYSNYYVDFKMGVQVEAKGTIYL